MNRRPIETPIPPAEAQEMMRDDIVARVSADIHCPLARAIADALDVLERSIEDIEARKH